MTVLPPTRTRVERHTAGHLNARFERAIERNVRHFARHPEEIDDRLEELEHEWDIERTLEANAASLALTGTLLGAFIDRRFLALPAVVTVFLLQHAVQGWCPPVPVLRRLGIRTATEIERERTALKALRGDFRPVDAAHAADRGATRAQAALHAAGA